MSAVHLDAYRGARESVLYLVEQGRDVKRVDDYGVDARHLAV